MSTEPPGKASTTSARRPSHAPSSDDLASLRRVARQQSALRRIAELVASGAPHAAVLEAVVNEAHRIFDVDHVVMLRYEDQHRAVVVAMSHGPLGLSVGAPSADNPGGLVRQVLQTGRPARLSAETDPGTPAVARLRDLGMTSGAAAPVMLHGRPWGVLTAMTRTGTVEPGLELALADFANLTATSIAAAQATDELRGIADEQAALRRVAELIARGASEHDVFHAVTAEAAALVGRRATTLVRETEPRTFTVLAAVDSPAAAGRTIKIPHDDEGVIAEVLRTGRAARVDDYTARSGPSIGLSDFAIGSSVAVPIVVDERTWGMLGITADEPIPVDTEQRLQEFAALVAAALTNSQARQRAEQLLQQQIALRQVAELAVRDVPAEQVLDTVATQASRLTGVDFSTLLRYEPDGSTEIVALDGAPAGVELGMCAPPGGNGATQLVWRTGRPARVDDLATVSTRWTKIADGAGYAASAAVPVFLQGGLWGALVVVGHEPLPTTTEEQLSDFADLTGIAISAAQARRELRALADEQAALRRVAELTARGAALDDVFGAVTHEASLLLDGPATALVRFNADGSCHVVASHASPAPVGLRIPPDPTAALTQVRDTGQPARTDTFTGTALQELANQLGVRAGLAVPVTVEQRVWGALTTSTSGPPPPDGTETRLMQFAELAAVAIAGAENRAALIASRARIVVAADEARHRIQRDVHDGAQQRLVHAIIALKLARDALGNAADPSDLVDEALANAERANRDLRNVVRGILPQALSHGLGAALRSLTDDLALPVTLDVRVPRLSPSVEATAYFLAAESLTNVAKHASATQVTVHAAVDSDHLTIEIADDGIGGADPASGTGLIGLLDRTDAAGGTLTIFSPNGGGTVVQATIPCNPPTP